jgi:hypothetical protein
MAMKISGKMSTSTSSVLIKYNQLHQIMGGGGFVIGS